MKNCFDCKHCKTFTLDYADRHDLKEYKETPETFVILTSNNPLVSEKVGKCLIGHNERMKTFREVHGNNTREAIEADRTLDMDCHDYNDGTKMLISLTEKTEELIKLLEKENDGIQG